MARRTVGINLSSTEDASNYIEKYILNHFNDGINYVLIMEHEGQLTAHERDHQPCYGEMRPYAKGYKDNGPYEPELMPEEQRKVVKPGDLYNPFPQGTPVMVGVSFLNSGVALNSLYKFVFTSPQSPWHKVYGGAELIYKGDVVVGVMLTDMNVDPTAFVHGIRMMRKSDLLATSMKFVQDNLPELTEQESFIVGSMINISGKTFRIGTDTYTGWAGWGPSISRLMNGDFINKTDGGTFAQRYAYNRPEIDYIWGTKENDINGILGLPWGKSATVSDLKKFADGVLNR